MKSRWPAIGIMLVVIVAVLISAGMWMRAQVLSRRPLFHAWHDDPAGWHLENVRDSCGTYVYCDPAFNMLAIVQGVPTGVDTLGEFHRDRAVLLPNTPCQTPVQPLPDTLLLTHPGGVQRRFPLARGDAQRLYDACFQCVFSGDSSCLTAVIPRLYVGTNAAELKAFWAAGGDPNGAP